MPDYAGTNEAQTTKTDSESVAKNKMQRMQSTANSSNTNYIRANDSSFNEFSYFIGGIDVTHQNIDQITPYIPGVSRLFMHKVPHFMDVAFKDITANFKSYIETGYKSVQGIQNLTADFTTIQGGFAEQSFENISKVTDSSNSIQVTLYEQTGSPVREFIETWMTGVRDPRSGIAHYHGMVQTPKNGNEDGYVKYCEGNHTAEFIFYDLDPTAHYIEFACMWAHCFPKEVPKDHLNYTSGTRDAVEMNLDFSGTKYESRYINDIAIYYLIRDQLEFNYLNFNPGYIDKNTSGTGYTQEKINQLYTLNLDHRSSTNESTNGGADAAAK